jgi:D-alanyl-D-alanine carboxypeptidase (penicillin-binding protein 5/6)
MAVGLVSAVMAAPARAATTTTVPAVPPPKAWILVDADTGNVVAAGNDRTPLPPASLTKVITALAASDLPPDTPVTVNAAAAAAPPDKIGLRVGQVWTADELFHALLISSANDAAIALAEQVGGTVAGFQVVFARTAEELGMADDPVLMDPAGLDGAEGVDGGNRVSARDLAIAGRALLADPYLAGIVATQEYNFVGPGNVHHSLVSHNKLFLAGYAGAVGIKTGFTDRAGTCLMAAARRDGRTMLAVVLNSDNPPQQAKALLDQGFATPVASESTADQLPPVNLAALRTPTAAVGVRSSPTAPTPGGASDGVPPGGGPPSAGPRNVVAVSGAGGHATSGSFGLLAAEGALALLLCIGSMVGTRRRRQRRRNGGGRSSRHAGPNLWTQPDGAPTRWR